MKRLVAGMTAALLAVILVFTFPANAISAQSAILLDCTSGRVLYSKQQDRRSLIASTTKIMTALIVCEQCNVLDRMQVPSAAIGIEGSSMYLQAGEVLTIQELLYGLMLHSGNDAATALAIYCGGTVEGFVEMMNDKANALGLENTHFENPHGLDGKTHCSTASDLARLASYAMENPIFAKIVSTKNVQVGSRYLKNHNKLLWKVAGADGVKTGYTKCAGRILVSSATRNRRRLVAVTISDPDDWVDHEALLEKGFSNYCSREIVAENTLLGTVEIAGGQENSVALMASENFVFPIAADETPRIVLPAPGFVYAPVVQGQTAGYARIYLADRCIGKVLLTYGSTVEKTEESKKGNFTLGGSAL